MENAKTKGIAQLQKLYDKAVQEVGESGAAIFEVHQMMMDDDDYMDSIKISLRQRQSMQNMQLLPQEITLLLCFPAWMTII